MISSSDPGDQSMPSLFQMEAVRYFFLFFHIKIPPYNVLIHYMKGSYFSCYFLRCSSVPSQKAYAGLSFLLYR